jgi:IS5 family transposase
MRPKQHETTGSGDLFRATLEQIINMKHELVQLAVKIDWAWIDGEIAPLYSDQGRPGIETRFVIGLLLLKHIFTDFPTKAYASAGSMIRISSTSPAKSSSSTAFRMSART